MKILGLDLGVNSIGWALIEKNAQEKVKIIDMGVVIPFTNSKDATLFAKGQELEANKNRRNKRTLRRLHYRKKRRNDMLFLLGKALGIIEKNANRKEKHLYKILFSNKTDINYKRVYEWRVQAISQKIELNQLIAVLFSMNQKRGYSHEVNFPETKIPVIAEITKNNPEQKTAKIKILQQPIQANINPEQEILISKELELKPNEQYFGFLTPKDGKYQFTLSKYQKNVKVDNQNYDDFLIYNRLLSQQKTPGQLFYEKIQQNENYETLKNIPLPRKLYINEFDKIWKKQEEFHPELTDPKVLQKMKSLLIAYLKPSAPVKIRLKKTDSLQKIVKDWILYYKRPLKKAIGRGRCFFERNKTTIARSHPLFQEFKIWQTINNLKRYDGTELPPEQKEKLFDKLWFWEKDEIKIRQIEEIIESKIKNTRLKINYNTTYQKIYKALKDFPEVCKKLKERVLEENTPLKELWHIIYSASDLETLKKATSKWLDKNFKNFPEEQQKNIIENIATIELEESYGDLSAKAIKKLLPLMRAGKYSKPSEEINGLKYNDAAINIYGAYKARYGAPYSNYDELEITEEDKLQIRHPIVLGISTSTLRLIKEIWKTYGKPDKIHIEFARELRADAKTREKITKMINNNRLENQKIRKILKDSKSNINVTLSLIQQYKFWQETKHKCLYCGQPITLELINQTAEIEHIIPRSVYFDDSQTNKIVAHKKCNTEKNKRTAFDYIASRGIKNLRRYLNTIKEIIEQNTQKIDNKDWLHALADELHNYSNKDLINKIYENEPEWENALNYFRTQSKPEAQKEKNKKKNNFKTLNEVIENGYWRAKLRKLLASLENGKEAVEKWAKFRKNQLQATKFASKQIRPYLERICPATKAGKQNILITSGGITARLREWWGLQKVWKEVVNPYYEELKKKSKKGNNPAEIIPSKRDDHRHHALDALIIACTTNQIIHKINTFHGSKDRTTEKEQSLKNFIKQLMPLDKDEVKKKLEDIIIFYRVKHRTAHNKYKKIIDKKGKLIKINLGKTVRGQLFNETAYSLITLPPTKLQELIDRKIIEISKLINRQYYFFHWKNPKNATLASLWQFFWQSSPKNQTLIQEGMQIIRNNNLSEKSKTRKLNKLIKTELNQNKDIVITILALTKKEPLSKITQKNINKIIDNRVRALISEMQNEADGLKNLEERLTEKLQRLQNYNGPTKINSVRIIKTVDAPHTYIRLSSKPNKPVFNYESVYVSYVKNNDKRIYYLYDVIKKRIQSIENAKKFYSKDSVYLADADEKISIENLDKSKIYIIKSMKASNKQFNLQHHSFIYKKKNPGNLSNLYKLRVNWLGKIENIE